jgi:hypothetical protein
MEIMMFISSVCESRNKKIILDLSIEDLPSADLTKPNNLAIPCLKFVEVQYLQPCRQ